MSDAFAAVHTALHGIPTKRGWFNATCPNCGKLVKKGQTHFGYSNLGAKCFACGWGGGLDKLAELLHIEIGEYIPPVYVEKPKRKIARWRLNPWGLLDRYENHPERYHRWMLYKPLTQETIEKNGLGYGSLPFWGDNDWYMSKTKFLTVPVYEDGALIRIHGRNTGNYGAKWVCASGSGAALFNADNLPENRIVWICENYVDALWLEQEYPQWSAVAIGGVSLWDKRWATKLASRKPVQVIVALDKDLVGNGAGNHHRSLIAEWKGKKEPVPAGPAIANDLLRVGVRSILFRWPDEAPAKAGVDWLLERGGVLF